MEYFFIVYVYIGSKMILTYASDPVYETAEACRVAATDEKDWRSFLYLNMKDGYRVTVEWSCHYKGEMYP